MILEVGLRGAAVALVVAGVVPAGPVVTPKPPAAPATTSRTVWDDLADCESGEWTADGHVRGSARWDSRAHGLYRGGLQFHPGTWDAYRDPAMPDSAADATREQQIEVAVHVQDEQGWGAWPVCSRRLGLR